MTPTCRHESAAWRLRRQRVAEIRCVAPHLRRFQALRAASAASSARRDGSEILRLVSELHGAQRQRLGWTEVHIVHGIDVLHAAVAAALGRTAAAGAADRDVLARATALVRRLLEQSRQASLRGFRIGQQVHAR